MEAQWLTEWSRALRVEAHRAMNEVVAIYLVDYDDPRIGPPSTSAELRDLATHLPWTPLALRELYRLVGPISLPDIANGYFIHEPASLVGTGDGNQRVDVVDRPDGRREQLVVFGSDGGGALYGLSVTGSVYRLRGVAYLDGVYDGSTGGFAVVAHDLPAFLEKLLHAVTAFARDGTITDV